jgi:type VI secretion system protein ImpJ
MALDPQHFQQWDRHHLAFTHARLRAIAPYGWGLTTLAVDEEALANGTVRLTRCSGVTPDGLVFSIPDTDPPPPPRAVAGHFAPTADRLGVYLAVPGERDGGANFLLPNATTRRETRFVVETATLIDETAGYDEREVEVARPNLMLKFDDEPLESYSTLQVAALARAPSGHYRLDETFVPPSLTIEASRALQAIVQRLLELLTTKSSRLSKRTRHLPRGQAALSAADVMSLSLQQTVNAFIPVLAHHRQSAQAHPEALYVTLAMLAGQLSALPGDADVHPRTLPPYDHDAPTACFAALHHMISLLLEPELEVNYVTIPLVRRDEVSLGDVDDPALFEQAAFYLIASGVASGTERAVAEQLRVAAPATMPGVLQGFVRALPLTWEPRPPTGAPARPELQYYRLERGGRFWDEMRSARSVAIYAPAHLNGLSIELIAVRDR